MKLFNILIAASLLIGTNAYAQDSTKVATTDTSTAKSDTAKKHGNYTFTIGNGGFVLTKNDTSKLNKEPKKKEEAKFSTHWVMIDLGVNMLQDNTNYNSAAAQNYLRVNQDMQNSNLFSLINGKSINVNIWPVMFKYRLVKTDHQRIYLTTGLGMQLYNFRYDNNITYVNSPAQAIVRDSISFKKNKIGLDYLNVPLMLTFKTKIFKDNWLVYGVGITGGVRIASWSKQVSGERGKEKLHDAFNFNDVNSCLTGEIGIDGAIRFYASYQLTNLYRNALDQHPFAIGIRFMGI